MYCYDVHRLGLHTLWMSLMFTLLRWFGYDRLTESVSAALAAPLMTAAL